MVRAALAPGRRIGQGPRPGAAYVPAISVLAAILTRSRDDKQDLQVRYVSGSDGLILGKDGRLLPPFESFSVP